MRPNNLIQQKSFDFAVRIVQVSKILTDKREYILARQLLKSGTSVGANVEESIGAQSKADFISKLSVAYKEARETVYWLKLLKATNQIGSDLSDSLLTDSEELCRIIGKIQITTKSNHPRR